MSVVILQLLETGTECVLYWNEGLVFRETIYDLDARNEAWRCARHEISLCVDSGHNLGGYGSSYDSKRDITTHTWTMTKRNRR